MGFWPACVPWGFVAKNALLAKSKEETMEGCYWF